jgi:hypothetical protein
MVIWAFDQVIIDRFLVMVKGMGMGIKKESRENP